MGYYIIVYLILSILVILGYTKIRYKNLLPFMAIAIIIGVQGLRWKTGTDWDAYYDCFMLSDKYQVEYVEFGYFLFNRIVRFFSQSYTLYLILQSCVMCVCQYIFAKQFKTVNPTIVLLYFFSVFLFPVRFNLAVSVFLLAYKYIVDRNFIKFLIIYIITVSIHQLMVLCLPLYFISHFKYKSKVLIGFYLFCCGLGIFTELVFGNLLSGVALIFNILPEFSQGKAMAYMEEPTESSMMLTTLISYINGLAFIILFLYFRKRFFATSNIYNVLLNLYIFGLAFTRIIVNTIPYLARFNMCVAGAFIILITLALKPVKKSKIIWVIGLCMFMFLSLKKNIDSYPELHIPYFSIWSNSNYR